MKISWPILAIVAGYFASHPNIAMAYIGPGLGLGAITAVVGVIGGIFLAIFGVLYYPIKRMIRNRRKKSIDPTPRIEE